MRAVIHLNYKSSTEVKELTLTLVGSREALDEALELLKKHNISSIMNEVNERSLTPSDKLGGILPSGCSKCD